MAGGKLFKTLKGRLLATILAIFVFVSVPSFSLLFYYMNSEVFSQRRRVSHNWVQGAADEINTTLSALVEAVSWICFNDRILQAVDGRNASIMTILNAQDTLSSYMVASPAWQSLNKIIVFNEDGVYFEYTKARNGALEDIELLLSGGRYSSIVFPPGASVHLEIGATLNEPHEAAVIAYGRMNQDGSYIYAEMNLSLFDPALRNAAVENLYIMNEEGFIHPGMEAENLFDEGGYSMDVFPLVIPGASLVHFESRRPLSLSSIYGLSFFLFLVIGSFAIVALVSLVSSHYISRSTTRLVKFLEKLTQQKSFGETDPSLEEGKDEFGGIGKAVNTMSCEIARLLESNDRLSEQKKETELSMLQMQVNPHFLYNTLESIHYLAAIQKAEGIASMSRGLSHLLKNIAKGNGERIPLSDELELVREYDEIQQVRYIGMYEIVYEVPEELMNCRIQKFTLQPLVENAIFHGIVPTGECGTITIKAEKDDRFLYVRVMDDGVGMSEEELAHIYDEESQPLLKAKMTGVGIRNINERIRLYYGRECSLSFTSKKGEGTVALVKILLEADDVQSDSGR